MQDFTEFSNLCNTRLELFLNSVLAKSPLEPSVLIEAMRYSTLSGGKRIRPLLVYALGLSLDIPFDQLDVPAAAIELIHVYSLIHDDLPSMDNDDFRRGKPSCHKAFNEAIAILAGDALQALAFELLSKPSPNLTPAQQILMINTLAQAVGKKGMVEGQILDITATPRLQTIDNLKTMHQKKTGALISAALEMPLIMANILSEQTIKNIKQYAAILGLAFQVKDDILDETSNSTLLGKTAGKDKQQGKKTFVSLMGLVKAQIYLQALYESANDILLSLNFLPPKDLPLKSLTKLIINRHF
ncbi:MAG: Polyprenyl synthetase [Francisellaceae bacterium]|nr:Polyprenyl synthetase [Francisellaceae bacterium]